MRTYLVVLALVISSSVVLAEPELKGSPIELANYLTEIPKTVTIPGEAEIKIQADRAQVNLKVVTEDSSLQKAIVENRQVRTKIETQLKEKGVAPENIRSSQFSSTPEYGWFGDKAKTYTVENMVIVTINSEEQFRLIAQLIDQNKEVRYLGMEYEHSDKDALKLKALANACEAVNAKKEIYEKTLNVALKPVSFSQPHVMLGVANDEYMARNASAGQYLANKVEKMVAPSAPNAPGDAPARFDELVFTAQITVDYQLTGK